MRDVKQLQTRDTRAIVEATISEDLPPLEAAVLQLEARLELAKHRGHDMLNRKKDQNRGLGR